NLANVRIEEKTVTQFVNSMLDNIPTMIKEAIYNGVLAAKDDTKVAYADSPYKDYTADELIASFIINTSNEAPWGTVVPHEDATAAANMTVKAMFDKYIKGFLNNYLSEVLQGLVGGVNDLIADPAANFGFLAGEVFDTSAAFTATTFDVDEVSIPKIVKVILQTLLSDTAETAIGLGNDINENFTKTARYILGKIANDNGGKHEWDGFNSDLSAYATTYNSVSGETAAVKIASLFMPFAFGENAPETEELEKLATWMVYKGLTGTDWMKDAIKAACPDIDSRIFAGSGFVDQTEKGYWFDIVFDMLLAVMEDALDVDSSNMHFNYTSDTSGGNWVNKLDNIVDWAFNYVDGIPAIADKVTNTPNVYDGYGPFYKADVVLNNLLPLDFINAEDATFKGENFDIETFVLLKLLPAVTDLDLGAVVDLLDFNAKPFNQKLGAAAAEIVDTLLNRLFSFSAGGSANFARNETNWTPLVEGSYDTTHGYYKSAKVGEHTWGAYKDDDASAGAEGTHTRACTYDAAHTESAPHRYDAGKVTTAATCTTDSISTFTCLDCGHKNTLTNAGTATGHAYGEASYSWASDNSSVTATRVCANDKSHVETETVAATGATTAPTCTAAGKTVYTSAAFANAAFAVQSKTVDIAATGHNWGEWKKADEKTHTRVCANDASHTETANHNFKATVTTEPTATAEGVRTYTCSDCGFSYTEPVALENSATGMDGITAVNGKDYPSNVKVTASPVTSGDLYDLAKEKFGGNITVASVSTSKSGSGKVWAKIALADGVKAEDVKAYTAEVKETGNIFNRKKVLETKDLAVTAGEGAVYVELPANSANIIITGNAGKTEPPVTEPPVTEPPVTEPPVT
ncbi:MAG: hypothetical protein IIZ66_06055, partial [Clostridia bacterium]|nr:hypothetical protein [Clostridia bacterium]